MEKKNKAALIIILSIILVVVVSVFVCIAYFFYVTKDVKLDLKKLEGNFSNVKIYDNKNNEIGFRGNNYAKYNEISPNIVKTFVSVEDKKFFKHNGIDVKRIFAATIKNIGAKSFKEGASTITQQLIKNTHLTNKKTIERKLNEIRLALKLEKVLPKEAIMEKYLNNIYFGSGIYGVYDACVAFYNKLPSDVNLAEAAMLVGVVKNPSKNSPIINFEGAKARQNVIFNVLENDKNFDKNSVKSAKNTHIILKNGLIHNKKYLSFIKNAIFESTFALNMDENKIAKSGFKIMTYLDDDLQNYNFNNALTYPQKNNYVHSVIDNKTLGVTSYITNLSVLDSQIKRQAGSIIKPFSVYLAGFEEKLINPLSQILDEKINFNGYSPKNFNNVYHGYVSVKDAIAHSYNVPAVKLLKEIGIDKSVDFLKRYNIKIKENDKNLSLALGSNSVSPLQIASAYASVANFGKFKKTTFIKKIIDSEGKVIYTNENDFKKVSDIDINYLMTDSLIGAVKNGTGYKLKNLPYQIACKTGTVANINGQNTDAWCCAFTTKHTFLSWNGSFEDEFLSNSHTGSAYPTLAVKDMALKLYENDFPNNFTVPNDIEILKINTAKLEQEHIVEIANDDDLNVISEYFSKNNLPPKASYPINFIVKEGLFENTIEFVGTNDKKYNIYSIKNGEKLLIKSIICNGTFVRFSDKKDTLFDKKEYFVEEIN